MKNNHANMRIRVAGLYVENNSILLVKHRKKNREYFLLPGGGVEPGEGTLKALKREWKEELSLEIQIGAFLFCGESVPPANIQRSQVFQIVFQIDKIKGTIKSQNEGALVGFKWVKIEDFPEIRFFPACKNQISDVLHHIAPSGYEHYNWLT